MMTTALLQGQDIAFRYLDIENGLGSNIILDVDMDQLGFMYVASGHGFYRYDGYQAVRLQNHPSSSFNQAEIKRVCVSNAQQIYAQTSTGDLYASTLGQEFTLLYTAGKPVRSQARFMVEGEAGQILLMDTDSSFSWDEKKKEYTYAAWLSQMIGHKTLQDVYEDQGELILTFYHGEALHLDLQKERIIGQYQMKHLRSATRIGPYVVLASDLGKINFYALSSGHLVTSISLDRALPDDKTANVISSIRPLNDHTLIIGTEDDGLHFYSLLDASYRSYRQNVMSDQSLSRDQIESIHLLENGTVAVIHYVGGISYFNTNLYQIHKVRQFYTETGEVFKSYVNDIVRGSDGRIWMAATDRVMEYDETTGLSRFHYFTEFDGDAEEHKKVTLGIRSLCLDRDQTLWVGSFKGGLIHYNPRTGHKTFFTKSAFQQGGVKIPSVFIWDLEQLSDGKIWVAHNYGFLTIDPVTHQVDTLSGRPPFSILPRVRCKTIFEDHKARVWLGTQSHGIFMFDRSSATLKRYTTKDGLTQNGAVQIREHPNGDLYVAHGYGVSVMKNDSTRFISLDTMLHLRDPYIEGLEYDRNGGVWLANHTTLIKMDPEDYSLTYYEHKLGIGHMSFITNASYRYAPDEGPEVLYFGTELGYIAFQPHRMDMGQSRSNALVHQVRSEEKFFGIGSDTTIHLTTPIRTLTFFYNGINLYGARNLYYRTRFEGQQDAWSSISTDTEISFSDLDPGQYTFYVQVSEDGSHWRDARHVVTVVIHRPFYKNLWFYLLGLALVGGAVITYLVRRMQGQRHRQQIRQQLSDLEVKAIRAQMNPHFVFNALNSIQYFTYSGEVDKANEYLSDFARLMRLVLQQSRDGMISLDHEIELLKLYLKIEALKFGDEFNYEVTADHTVTDAAHIQMPSMIIQPFAENAIKHGLMPKKGPKSLSIHFSQQADMLICTVYDDGIGMEASRHLMQDQTMKVPHQSMGMDLVHKRLEMYQSQSAIKADIRIEEHPEGGGTRITLSIPI